MDVIVRNTKQLPAIMCVQRKAPKCVPTEDDFFQSNINSFGNDVGSTTNKITSMFEVQSRYPVGSREYNILDYRIKCGQLYQQNAIDKTKGIDAKPMPESWSDWASNRLSKRNKEGKIELLDLPNDERKKRVFNRNVIADKKPYFMRYIYPQCDKEYMNYIKYTSEKCRIKFDKSLDELIQCKSKTDEESRFFDYYESHFPLGMSPCVVNRICWKIEKEFDGKLNTDSRKEFDYSILQSTGVIYSTDLYKKIQKIYKDYKTVSSRYSAEAKNKRIKSDERRLQRYAIKSTFINMCLIACPDEDILCNIILDMCYKNNSSKQFAWDVCGKTFIKNLLRLNDFKISYPTKSGDGDIIFNGEKFKIETCDIKVEVNVDDSEENE
jgi:hypothetical protein